MNAIVAQMLGEADHHSPEERAQLDQHAQGGEAETGGGAEERKEVALAKKIVAAAQAGESQQVIQLAQQLIRMHRPKPQDREGRVGEITPDDFLSGMPFRLSPKGVRPLRNERPLSKQLTMSMMALPPSKSFPSSP